MGPMKRSDPFVAKAPLPTNATAASRRLGVGLAVLLGRRSRRQKPPSTSDPSLRSIRASAACAATALVLSLVPGFASAQTTILSNTPVTQSQRGVSFNFAAGTLVDSEDGNASGIHLKTNVWSAKPGSPGDGLSLYSYFVEGDESRTLLRWLRVPFAARLDFDIDNDGDLDGSSYCSSCTTQPVPVPPNVAVEIDEEVYFNFDAGIATFSTSLYLVSDRPPVVTTSAVMLDGIGIFELTTLPEPEPGLAGVAAVAALGLRARSRARAGPDPHRDCTG